MFRNCVVLCSRRVVQTISKRRTSVRISKNTRYLTGQVMSKSKKTKKLKDIYRKSTFSMSRNNEKEIEENDSFDGDYLIDPSNLTNEQFNQWLEQHETEVAVDETTEDTTISKSYHKEFPIKQNLLPNAESSERQSLSTSQQIDVTKQDSMQIDETTGKEGDLQDSENFFQCLMNDDGSEESEGIENNNSIESSKGIQYSTDKHANSFPEDYDIAAYTGYVTHFVEKHIAGNGGEVAHIILGNKGKAKIQISAWGTLTSNLEEVQKKGLIIEAENLLAKNYGRDYPFNHGNVDAILIVQKHSIFKVLGELTEEEKKKELNPDSQYVQVDFDSIHDNRGFISINAFVKIPMRKVQLRNGMMKNIGSITNGKYQIEIHFDQNVDITDFKKGDEVNVKGRFMKKYNTDLDIISIKDVNDIKKLGGKANLHFLLGGFQYL